MDLAQRRADRYCSREEFRQWCEAQTKGRHERVDGRIVAMAPERGAHLRVKGSVNSALKRAVADAGVPCQALPNGATVETNFQKFRGWESWIHFEPCAWRRSQISHASSRKSGRHGSPPDAATPGVRVTGSAESR